VDEAFRKNTDGEDCPISFAYQPRQFAQECETAGFVTRFVGGYFAAVELSLYRSLGSRAKADRRLADEHRSFVRELEIDPDGFPRYRGRHAGIGGVYHLVKSPQHS
jgi:hypothetical protein